MEEWTEVLTDAGFSVVHKERLPKDMEFQSWAERLGSDPATIERLRSMLTDGSPALQLSSSRARTTASSGSPWTKPS
jgi:hypothetical protein